MSAKTDPPNGESRAYRKWFLLAALLLVIVAPAVLLLTIHRASPVAQIVLVSSPTPSSKPMVHYRPNFNWSENSYITQNCYIAEVQLKNLGPGSIMLPYRGGMSVEIQESAPTNWVGVNEGTLGVLYKPISPGGTLNFRVRIPATAERWRVSTTYSRWFLPQRLLNHVLRDWFHMDLQVGDRKEYSAESDVWELKHLSPRQQAHRTSQER